MSPASPCINGLGVNEGTIAYCPAGYKVTGAAFTQSSYCGFGLGTGVAGFSVQANYVVVWPVDNPAYGFAAIAICSK